MSVEICSLGQEINEMRLRKVERVLSLHLQMRMFPREAAQPLYRGGDCQIPTARFPKGIAKVPATAVRASPKSPLDQHPDKGEVLAAEAGFSFARAHLRPVAVAVTSVCPFLPPSFVLRFEREEIQSKDDRAL